jgi:alpha-beta hydrolase superfamily lysophospholipase
MLAMPSLLTLLSVLLLLVACAPKEQPQPQAIQQPSLSDSHLLAGDGRALPVVRYLPEKEPKAVILALHGFNDYSNAFALPGEWMAQHGVAVYAFDQRGFGDTADRGIWAGMANLHEDTSEMLDLLSEEYPDVPLYLLGESMGGAVAITLCAQRGCDQADGLILSAPAVWGGDSMSILYRLPLILAAYTMPGATWTGEDLEVQATDNIELLMQMSRDPMIIFESRTDAIYGLVNLMGEAAENISELKLPVLYLYGERDDVIPPEPTARAIHAMHVSTTVAYYPEGYHMLLRDLQRETVYRDITSWMQNRYKPLPSGHDMGWGEKLGLYE